MKRLIFILITVFLLPLLMIGQELKFDRLIRKDGLSQSVVTDILQDNRGYMWFATQDGLNKYNGYKFEVFKYNPKDSNTISDNSIRCLYQSKDGLLWIGTNGGGLNSYNWKTNSFKSYRESKESSPTISDDNVLSITEDDQGILWVGTDNGLNAFDRKTGKCTIYKKGQDNSEGLSSNRISDLLIDKKNRFWVGTYGGGLHLFKPDEGKFVSYLETDSAGEPKVENSHKVKKIFQGSRGMLWVCTNGGGLVRLSPEKNEFKYLYPADERSGLIINEQIATITEDAESNLWIGTLNGLYIYERDREKFRAYRHEDANPYSLSSNNIKSLFRSRKGMFWIGTDGGGVNIYKSFSNRFNHYYRGGVSPGSGSSDNIVMGFEESPEGNIWVGTLGEGLNVFNKEKELIANYNVENKLHDRILALHTDSKDRLWCGSWGGGVNFYSFETGEFSEPFLKENSGLSNNTVLDITEGREGVIWIATYGGLNKFESSTGKITSYFTEDGLSNDIINTLFYDKSKDVLWVGTAEGLNEFNLSTGEIKIHAYHPGKQSLSDNTIRCIYKDSKGALWVGTKKGLNKFNPEDNSFKSYYDYDGLPNDHIYGILEDEKGHLWISTNKGLCEFKPEVDPGKENPFRSFFEVDGLQSNEFNQGAFLKSREGEMFFGGINGFNAFYPGNIKDNQHPPEVYITSFKIFEREVNLDTAVSQKKIIELSYKDKFFSFEFVALDYVLPSKNLYSWKMEGLDTKWTPPSNRRFASYSNLDGGDYVFKVRASNSDGVWNDKEASIRIRVIPPFWKTNAFYGICVLLVIIAVFLYTRLRTRMVKKENRILEEKVEERTKEIEEKNRDILSSIEYAKRIQEAILPPLSGIRKHLPKSFILYMPKDIVSGDFYWFSEKNGKKIIAAVDCTGHGVPGAFMSMIGHNLLNQYIIEENIEDPGEILSRLNKAVINALQQKTRSERETADGMDIALCVIDENKNTLNYAGAYRPLYLLRDNEVQQVDPSKFPIGGAQFKGDRVYETHEIKLQKGDTFYLTSDGYADQFGGAKGKKFMVKRFKQLLVDKAEHSMREQGEEFKAVIEKWMENEEQIDDILVIGIRI